MKTLWRIEIDGTEEKHEPRDAPGKERAQHEPRGAPADGGTGLRLHSVQPSDFFSVHEKMEYCGDRKRKRIDMVMGYDLLHLPVCGTIIWPYPAGLIPDGPVKKRQVNL